MHICSCFEDSFTFDYDMLQIYLLCIKVVRLIKLWFCHYRHIQAKLEKENLDQRKSLEEERSKAQDAAERAKEMIQVTLLHLFSGVRIFEKVIFSHYLLLVRLTTILFLL